MFCVLSIEMYYVYCNCIHGKEDDPLLNKILLCLVIYSDRLFFSTVTD